MQTLVTKYFLGQILYNPQFHYRGVVIDIDAQYSGSEKWYRENAAFNPPKNEPWYHLLAHNSEHRLYVAESLLEPDRSEEPIVHSEIDYFFKTFEAGRYILRDNLIYKG